MVVFGCTSLFVPRRPQVTVAIENYAVIFVTSFTDSLHRAHSEQGVGFPGDPDGVSQGPAEAFEMDLHHVAIGQAHSFAEAEGIGPEEVDVDIAGAAVRLEFE